MDLLDWLEQRREREGLTAEQFADSLGISPSIYSRYVNRRLAISRSSMWKVVEHYDSECQEIIAIWKASRRRAA